MRVDGGNTSVDAGMGGFLAGEFRDPRARSSAGPRDDGAVPVSRPASRLAVSTGADRDYREGHMKPTYDQRQLAAREVCCLICKQTYFATSP